MANMLVLSTFQDNLRSDNGYLELTPSYLSTVTKLVAQHSLFKILLQEMKFTTFICFPFAAF